MPQAGDVAKPDVGHPIGKEPEAPQQGEGPDKAPHSGVVDLGARLRRRVPTHA
jgi:hypothetical protein